MAKFSPQILPEDPPPNYITDIQKQELLDFSNTRLVWGEGNPLAPIFVILDNPGARENSLGEPFLCGTRETLQRGAFDAGINIDKVYVSYLLKSRPTKKYDKETARLVSKKYLLNQIEHHQPKVIFCLGNVVVQAYFNHLDATVKNLRGKCYIIDNIATIVSYHPLAVRRRPTLYKNFVNDWALVGTKLQ